MCIRDRDDTKLAGRLDRAPHADETRQAGLARAHATALDTPAAAVVSALRGARCGSGDRFYIHTRQGVNVMLPPKPEWESQDKLCLLYTSAGATVLVSADCGCLLNLHHAAQKQGGQASGLPRCVHLGSFLRERMGAPDAAREVTD